MEVWSVNFPFQFHFNKLISLFFLLLQYHRDLSETGGQLPTNIPDAKLIQETIDASNGGYITIEDLKRTKFKRESDLNVTYPGTVGIPILRIASRAEIFLVVNTMQDSTGSGIPVEWFRTWFGEERLPEGYVPQGTTGLFQLFKEGRKIDQELNEKHDSENSKKRTG